MPVTESETQDTLAATGTASLDAVLAYNIMRSNGYLGPSLDAGLRGLNLTGTQFNTLLVLREAAPGGLLMSEIGERLVVTKSNVTGLVDRLEAQGLAERRERADRRATAVRLTAAGARLLRRALPRHAKILAELTDCLTAGEKRTLVSLLSKLRHALRQGRGACGGQAQAPTKNSTAEGSDHSRAAPVRERHAGPLAYARGSDGNVLPRRGIKDGSA